MIFNPKGTKKWDFWTINDEIDWAIIPVGTIKNFPNDTPIRLQVGNASFGERHICNRHEHWLRKLKTTAPELIYKKLGQSGVIFCTESKNKIKITMRMTPDSLMVLNYVSNNKYGDFFTVTTLYQQHGRLDGEAIGRYISSYRLNHK